LNPVGIFLFAGDLKLLTGIQDLNDMKLLQADKQISCNLVRFGENLQFISNCPCITSGKNKNPLFFEYTFDDNPPQCI